MIFSGTHVKAKVSERSKKFIRGKTNKFTHVNKENSWSAVAFVHKCSSCVKLTNNSLGTRK